MAGRLLEILVDTGAIAPTWLVQTQAVKHQELQASGANQQAINAQMQEGSSVAGNASGGGAGGSAHVGNAAMAIQGHATQSAHFKTQSFGALVVHLTVNAGWANVKTGGTTVEDTQNQTKQSAEGKSQSYGAMVVYVRGSADMNEALKKVADTRHTPSAGMDIAATVVYRNTDADAYLEKTHWVSATDAQGNVQGLLVLDLNANWVVETGDFLNDMHWLDANKDLGSGHNDSYWRQAE